VSRGTDGPAVIVQIAGGLGNQLFEYAFGRSLALRNDVPLVLDHRSCFPHDFYKRVFTLDKYHIQCGLVPPSEDRSSFFGRARRRVARYRNARLPISRRSHVLERDEFACDPDVAAMRITRPTLFEGVWQHEEYFAAHRDILLQDLTLRVPISDESKAVAERIQESNAVCLHVRRLLGVPNQADAKPLAPNAAIHLDPSYYDRAVAFVAERVSRPKFFVFADYPDWAKEHLRLPFPAEFVFHNGPDRDYEDLWLMSQCRAFIVANSTFSWWGAWLATHPDKLVVAPESGIGCGLKSIPVSWQRL
jgi:hypothetical protein